MAVSKWSWSASNGTATAAQVQAAYNALTNKGRTKAFNYTVWNDIVTKISAVRSDWGDVAWNEHYEFLPFDESKMKSGDIMTADRFNTAVGNIPLFGYAWPWEPTLGRTEILKGDRCYGKYFVWLTDGLNHWIGLTKLPFSIHNSFYLGDNASIQQKDSHPLVHTKGLALGKTLKMSNLAAHDFVVHNNLMHLDHSFVMTNMPNALAFSSTFNFFDFNTLMAGAETHIAGNQILNIGLGQKIEGLFTESLPLAHYLPATSEEIILADRFTRSIGNAIYGAHSGVVSGLTMSGTSHSANSLSLDYTGEMQTGYKFNFSLDINSGIGEYLNYISVLDSFTMTASSIKENEYQGGVAIGNTAELASADLFDLANDTGEIALLHSMEMDLLETAASETNCKIDIVVSADAGIIQTAALVADYGIGVTCETNGGAGDTVPMITNEIIESKADVDLCSANEVGMQSDYEAETVLNVMLAAATFRSLYAIRSIKVLSDALAMALNNVNMASNLMLDTSLNAIVDEMDSKYMLSQTVINHNATALLEPTSDVEMSANHKIMALYGAAVEMLSNKALSAEYSIASTIISALDELVGKNLETDLTIGDSTQAGITTITDTELNTDYQIVTAESANADTTKYRLVMTTLALTAVTTALLEPTSDVEMSANHKIMALYGAAVEMLSNKALSAEYSIASTIISALDELVGKPITSKLAIKAIFTASAITMQNIELYARHGITTPILANLGYLSKQIMSANFNVSTLVTAIVEPTTDTELAANHKIRPAYTAFVENLDNTTLAINYRILGKTIADLQNIQTSLLTLQYKIASKALATLDVSANQYLAATYTVQTKNTALISKNDKQIMSVLQFINSREYSAVEKVPPKLVGAENRVYIDQYSELEFISDSKYPAARVFVETEVDSQIEKSEPTTIKSVNSLDVTQTTTLETATSTGIIISNDVLVENESTINLTGSLILSTWYKETVEIKATLEKAVRVNTLASDVEDMLVSDADTISVVDFETTITII